MRVKTEFRVILIGTYTGHQAGHCDDSETQFVSLAAHFRTSKNTAQRHERRHIAILLWTRDLLEQYVLSESNVGVGLWRNMRIRANVVEGAITRQENREYLAAVLTSRSYTARGRWEML